MVLSGDGIDNITIREIGGATNVSCGGGIDEISIENVGGACALSCAGGNIIDVENGELMLVDLALYFCQLFSRTHIHYPFHFLVLEDLRISTSGDQADLITVRTVGASATITSKLGLDEIDVRDGKRQFYC